ETTGLLMIDPYNDFISEGGKLWIASRASQRLMIAFLICCSCSPLRERWGCGFSTRCTIDTVPATTRPGSTQRRFRKEPGHEKHLNTECGAANFAPSLRLNRVTSLPRSIGVRVALPIPIWIYC